jgi:hypothetical protein
MGTEGQERCYTERRKEDHGKRLSGMWEDKQMQGLCCQTNHIKWKRLGSKKHKLHLVTEIQPVLEMGRYLPVHRIGTSFFLNFMPAHIIIHCIHLSFSIFLTVYPCFAFKKLYRYF